MQHASAPKHNREFKQANITSTETLILDLIEDRNPTLELLEEKGCTEH
jgi:hypothetical protein